jgi:hypothetical protein
MLGLGRDQTGGSLLPVWLLHASIAITGYLVPALPSLTQGAVSCVVALLVIAAGSAEWFSRPLTQPRFQV